MVLPYPRPVPPGMPDGIAERPLDPLLPTPPPTPLLPCPPLCPGPAIALELTPSAATAVSAISDLRNMLSSYFVAKLHTLNAIIADKFGLKHSNIRENL